MNPNLTPELIDGLTNNQLQAELAERGLPTSGNKTAKADRLKAALVPLVPPEDKPTETLGKETAPTEETLDKEETTETPPVPEDKPVEPTKEEIEEKAKAIARTLINLSPDDIVAELDKLTGDLREAAVQATQALNSEAQDLVDVMVSAGFDVDPFTSESWTLLAEEQPELAKYVQTVYAEAAAARKAELEKVEIETLGSAFDQKIKELGVTDKRRDSIIRQIEDGMVAVQLKDGRVVFHQPGTTRESVQGMYGSHELVLVWNELKR